MRATIKLINQIRQKTRGERRALTHAHAHAHAQDQDQETWHGMAWLLVDPENESAAMACVHAGSSQRRSSPDARGQLESWRERSQRNIEHDREQWEQITWRHSA